MNRSKSLFLLFLGLACYAEASSVIQIISPKELANRLSQVTLIDARESDFEKNHIPGSVSVRWQDWTVRVPGIWNYIFGRVRDFGRIPPPTLEVRERLRNIGLSNEKEIVSLGCFFTGVQKKFRWLTAAILPGRLRVYRWKKAKGALRK